MVNISEQLIQAAVDKAVSEKLGTLLQELDAFTKDMNTVDKLAARFVILEMMRDSCGIFYDKMRARISSDKV